jgi:hypothetical protein
LPLGLSALLAFTSSGYVEPMDLGKISKDVVQGWCGAHKVQFFDWGEAGVICAIDTGGAMYAIKTQIAKAIRHLGNGKIFENPPLP